MDLKRQDRTRTCVLQVSTIPDIHRLHKQDLDFWLANALCCQRQTGVAVQSAVLATGEDRFPVPTGTMAPRSLSSRHQDFCLRHRQYGHPAPIGTPSKTLHGFGPVNGASPYSCGGLPQSPYILCGGGDDGGYAGRRRVSSAGQAGLQTPLPRPRSDHTPVADGCPALSRRAAISGLCARPYRPLFPRRRDPSPLHRRARALRLRVETLQRHWATRLGDTLATRFLTRADSPALHRGLHRLRERIEGTFHAVQYTGRPRERLWRKTILGLAMHVIAQMTRPTPKHLLRRCLSINVQTYTYRASCGIPQQPYNSCCLFLVPHLT